MAAPVQIEDEGESGVGDFLHTEPGHVAHSHAELAGRLDVDVVDAGADAHDDAERLKLIQVLACQRDGVPHQRPDGLVQHLQGTKYTVTLFASLSSSSSVHCMEDTQFLGHRWKKNVQKKRQNEMSIMPNAPKFSSQSINRMNQIVSINQSIELLTHRCVL